MRRYIKLIITAVITGMLLQACTGTKKEKEAQNPNIIFFLIDDQRNDVIGCAGHPFDFRSVLMPCMQWTIN
ncbi:MAG: hypothetical protein ACQERS_08190 [Bacteroidota bacterium]